MRGPFRYISVDKLNAMTSTNRWWRRTTLKVRASLPWVVSADATVEPASADLPARVEQVESALRKDNRVVSAHDVVSRRNGMFEFDGPARIMAAADAFWVATATDGVAILLVGSLKHVVGAVPPRRRRRSLRVSIPRQRFTRLSRGSTSTSTPTTLRGLGSESCPVGTRGSTAPSRDRRIPGLKISFQAGHT